MPDTFLKEIKEELRKGAENTANPFHCFTLATLGVDNFARLRTVVLREVSDDLRLTFFTDKRSKKITHIKENKRVSGLFYHPGKLLQLRVQGVARINRNPDLLKNRWIALGTGSKKSYRTKEAPGSVIESPANLEYLKENDYFSVVEIEPFKIEYLKLEQPDHIRIRFSKEGLSWRSEFLVP